MNLNKQNWQQLICELPWNPKSVEASATIALSKASWFGLSQDDAIQTILKLPAASYLRENRHLLYAAWQQITREINGESILFLELEPLFESAA